MDKIKQKTLDWDKAKLKEFKKAYEEGVINRGSTFMFEGHEFYVTYAKYLIEHLTNEFNLYRRGIKLWN